MQLLLGMLHCRQVCLQRLDHLGRLLLKYLQLLTA